MPMKRMILTTWLVIFSVDLAFAGSWPAYRADAARTGYTSETLPDELALQ